MLIQNRILEILAVAGFFAVGFVAWRCVPRSSESSLHRRMATVFGFLVIGPAAVVSFFAVLFFHLCLQTWFDAQVFTAVKESQEVAQAYLREHKKGIESNMRAMIQDMENKLPSLIASPDAFDVYLTEQTQARSLSEAVILTQSGRTLARSKFSLSLASERISPDLYAQSEQCIVLFYNETCERVLALFKISSTPKTYLLLGRFVDKTVLQKVESAESAASSYFLLQKEKNNFFKIFLFLFLLLNLLLIVIAMWGGMHFANQIALPLKRILNAAEEVMNGCLTVNISHEDISSAELQALAKTFNQMVLDLNKQQTKMQATNRQLHWRSVFMENVLRGVSSGVLSITQDGVIALQNPQAMSVLNLGPHDAPKTLDETVPEFMPLFQQSLQHRGVLQRDQVPFERQGKRMVAMVSVCAPTADASFQEVVLTFDDVTTLLAAQKQAMWSDVARRVAHEIKNPLTPIRLASERLRSKYIINHSDNKEEMEELIQTIFRNVNQISTLVSEFSSFARMPTPALERQAVHTLVQETLWVLKKGHPEVHFHTVFPAHSVFALCDRQQILQAVFNLLKNALESTLAFKKKKPAFLPKIRVVLKEEGINIWIGVHDNGPGFAESFFAQTQAANATTKPDGMGLGLVIVDKIAQDHKGFLKIENTKSGASTWFVFPKLSSDENNSGN